MTNTLVKYAVFSALAAVFAGCGMNIAIIDNSVTPDADLTTARSLKLMDSDGPLYIKETVSDDGKGTYEFSQNRQPIVDTPDIVTADFHQAEYNLNQYMVVEGQIADGKTYPFILDTGANLDALIIQDIHIRQNDLQVFPLNKTTGPESKMSLCSVDNIQIGDFKLSEYTAICWGQHTELKFLGLIPLGRSKDICFPLPMMRKFKYFKFDTPARQVEFSARKSFKPQQDENWHKFPMTVEYIDNDPAKQLLFIEMQINGQNIRPMLDTGAGLGLMMDNHLWHQVKGSFNQTSQKNTNFILPYHFKDNKPNCKAVTVETLDLGDISINNAEVIVMPKSKNWKKTDCIMGMAYFKDKQVTIDFQTNTLWVKKS